MGERARYVAALRVVFFDAVARGGRLTVASVGQDPLSGLVLRYRLADEPVEATVGSLPDWVETVGAAVVYLADLVQEILIEAGPDRSWPGCVAGHPHPPVARLVADAPAWTCPRTGVTVDRIGG